MQELHRDLTKHHSLINTESMEEILERAVNIDEQIAAQYSTMQTLRAMFEEVRLKDIITEPFQLLLWLVSKEKSTMQNVLVVSLRSRKIVLLI